jgi:superfamily II DNA or RNA helicase
MAGLYLSEMRRLGLVNRALVVVPAGLVSKWQADFNRFFDTGLRRIKADTIHEDALGLGHDLWVVSLELAAVNAAVQDAIRPDKAGWDLVVFDEAHRLTPTALSLHRVGRLLAHGSPRVLLMTATPHRGSEWLFRHLLHLVDPEVYPDPGDEAKRNLPVLRPSSIHFLRRMKEDLVDHDGVTPLFKRRHATNYRVPLNEFELDMYARALGLVDRFFAAPARALARMVYGKRTASSLYALAETLKRRLDHMGELSAVEATAQADPEGEDEATRDEARVINADSAAPRAERAVVSALIAEILEHLQKPVPPPSKWRTLVDLCLKSNGIAPAGPDRAVIFTEYFDSATWIARRLIDEGYSARVYSGRQTHTERDQIRAHFVAGEFQIIVSTDAGNEGIDLQVAHVLVNYDIPWSLVRLEQRMGRIHRVGQSRDVELYNLIATDTREGDTLLVLLENFVTAANELNGQMFDSLSLVAELSSVRYEDWLRTLYGDDESAKADVLAAVSRIDAAMLQRQAAVARDQEAVLATRIDMAAGLARVRRDAARQLEPAVVEEYLRRLAAAEVIGIRHTAAGDGVLLVTADLPFTEVAGGTREVLVVTERNATNVGQSQATPLIPGEPAFAALVAGATKELEADVYRGATVVDPKATDAYDLFAFTSALHTPQSAGGTVWSVLVRVEASGVARHVEWETLANLLPHAGRSQPPEARQERVAARAADQLLEATVARDERAWRDWFAVARREMGNLPIDLTRDIRVRSDRIALRDRLAATTRHRLMHLEELCRTQLEPVRRIAWLHVVPCVPVDSRHDQEKQ